MDGTFSGICRFAGAVILSLTNFNIHWVLQQGVRLFLGWAVMQGVAMLLQNRYQRQRLYTRIALGKVLFVPSSLCTRH